jgi:putative addiction module killer protein
MKKYKVLFTPEFQEWMTSRTKKERLQIQERLDLIATAGHFGDHHSVSEDNSIWELRWANGRRVYYCFLPKTNILILIGGDKNGQKKDIARAGKVLSKRS